MPNIKSNKKNLRKSQKKSVDNRAVLSRMRTQLKKIIKLVGENKTDKIDSELSLFYKYADKAVKKGVIKKNNVNRKKSEITKKVLVFKKNATES